MPQRRWWMGCLIVMGSVVSLAARPPLWVEAPPPPRLWVDPRLVITPAEQGGAPPPAGPGLTGVFAPAVAIAPGETPTGGYLSLSAFGTDPIIGMGDDTLLSFNVPAFVFGARVYTKLGISSNGYVVLGETNNSDNTFLNQHLPSPTRPNNVLAAFWTDLNPASGGAVRVDVLTDGADSWIVVDWAAVPEFSNAAKTHSFEIFIGVNGDAHPGEDVSYAYGAQSGNGDGGFLTVGAENNLGTRGQMTYIDSVGNLPANGTQLRVTTDTHTRTYLPAVGR